MALNPSTLAAQLTALTTEGKSQEALTLEFAQIISVPLFIRPAFGSF